MKIILLILFVFSLLILFKVFVDNSIWEKVLLLNLFSVKFILHILVYAIIVKLYYLIDIAFIYSILGFVSIVWITRFVGKRGKYD